MEYYSAVKKNEETAGNMEFCIHYAMQKKPHKWFNWYVFLELEKQIYDTIY